MSCLFVVAALLLSVQGQVYVLRTTFYVSYGNTMIEMNVSDSNYPATARPLLPRGYSATRIGRAVGVGCDAEQGLVCWSDIGTKTIRCAQLTKIIGDGSKGMDIYTVLSNLNRPEGVALDSCSELLYWTDVTDRMVWMARIRWNNDRHLEALYQRPIITDLDKPRGIAVDSCAEYVFFTDWSDTNPRVGRSSLDGSQVVSLVSSSIVVQPNALTLHREARLVYFGDSGSKKIYSVNYDGTNLRLVASVANVFDIALSCSKEYLYYTDWSVPFPRRLNLTDGSVQNIPVTSQEKYLFGICSFCDNCSCQTQCKFRNGGCSHFCVPSFNDTLFRRCSCPSGFNLRFQSTCSDNVERLVSSYPRSFLVSPFSTNVKNPSEAGNPLSVSSPTAIASMDSTIYRGSKYLVFTSETDRTVERVTIDGRFRLTLASGLPKPHGVAVDQLTSNVYYSDAQLGFIGLVDFEGRYRVRCLSGLQRAGGLAFDHVTGYLYYTDFGPRPMIGRVDGDCSNHSIIVKTSLSSPVHIALDQTRRVLYWTDVRLRRIGSYNIQTKTVAMVLSGIQLGYPFGIYYKDDTLFWTDWVTKCVHSSSVMSLNQTEKLICRSKRTDIPADVTSTHPVSIKSTLGTCSCMPPKFCLTSTGGVICRCPSGYQEDGNKCRLPGPFVLVATLAALKAVSTKGSNHWVATIPLPPQRKVLAVEYDYRDELIFWTDVELPSRIQSARFDGSELRTLVTHIPTRDVCQLCSPAGLAYDWVCRCLYWSDECTGEICYICLNRPETGIKQFLRGLDKPRGIVVNPSRKELYFTDWGSSPRIAQASLSTCSRGISTVVSLQTNNLQWPNDVALHPGKSALLYGNAGQRGAYIGSRNLGVKFNVQVMSVGHLFGLDACNDTMYWTDWSANRVYAAALNGLNMRPMASFRGNGIKAVCLLNQAVVGLRNIIVSVKPGNVFDAGRAMTITCKVFPDLIPLRIVLLKDGRRIKELQNAPSLTYEVSKTTVEDSGRYVCRASLDCCSNEAAVTVTVNRLVIPSCPCKKKLVINARIVCAKNYDYAFEGTVESVEVKRAKSGRGVLVCYVIDIRTVFKDTKQRILSGKLGSGEPIKICKPGDQCCPQIDVERNQDVIMLSHLKGKKLHLSENALVVGSNKKQAINRIVRKCK